MDIHIWEPIAFFCQPGNFRSQITAAKVNYLQRNDEIILRAYFLEEFVHVYPFVLVNISLNNVCIKKYENQINKNIRNDLPLWERDK